MNLKATIFLIAVTALMMGSACAAGIGDFQIDKNYKNAVENDYYTINLDDGENSGIAVFKNVDDDSYDNITDDDQYDNLVKDDGRDYLTADDDFELDKKSDNTAEFKDIDDANHGIVEVVKKDGEEYIVVFFAKDSSDIKNSDLSKSLETFNKDNDVKAVEF